MKLKLLNYVLLPMGFIFSNGIQAQNDTGPGDTAVIEEVSVTATGMKQSTRKMGYTTSQVQGKRLATSGEGGVIQALSGKASNVQITKNSGDPGAGAYIQIRGQNTITGNTQPLIIVDGVPVSNSSLGGGIDGVVQQSRLNDINPQDIENVEVLKGAAAAAIWGTRAANGVILITTKKGKKGVHVEFTSSLSLDYVNREYEKQGIYGQGSGGKFVANAGGSFGDKIALRSGADSFNMAGAKFVADDGSVYRPILKKGDNKVYNDVNRDQVFRTGVTWNNNISISSATDKSSIFFSASDWNQQGVLNGMSDYRRTTGRLNFVNQANDKLSISLNGFVSKIFSNRIQQGSNLDGLYLGYLRTSPDFDNTDYSGTYYSAAGIPTFNAHRGYRKYLGNTPPTYNNPGWTLNKQTNTSDVTRFTVTPEIGYKYANNSKMTVRVGYDMSNDRRLTYFPVNSASSFANGSFTDEFIQESELSFHAINQSDFKINSDLKINTTVGYLYTSYNLYDIGGTASQFILTNQDRYAFINSTSANKNPFNSVTKTLNNRVYGIADIEYKDKIFIQATLASEASSTYNNRFFSPSASVGYEFTKDMAKNDMLSYGKLRVSGGIVGVAPPPYIWGTNYVNASSASGWGDYMDASQFGGSIYRSSTKGNPNIKPESKTEIEMGADLKFLKNKVSLGFTYYQNKTEGAILAVAVPASSGYSNQWKNAANITNSGLEFDLNVNLMTTKDFTWNLYGNMGMNKNIVESLSGATSVFLDGFTGTSSRAVVGEAMGSFWGGKFMRDESGKYVLDANGFPQQAVSEGIIGNPNPKYRGSIGMNATYKGLTMNVLVETSQGNQMWAGTYAVLNNFGITPETANEVTVSAADAAKIVNVNGKTIDQMVAANADGSFTVRGNLEDFNNNGNKVLLDQSWYTGLGGGFGSVSEHFIKDASWVRIREVSLNYVVPTNICKMMHVPGLTLGFSARNLALWTKFPGIDPETNLSGVSNGRGLDYFTNPGTRSYMFSLKVNL